MSQSNRGFVDDRRQRFSDWRACWLLLSSLCIGMILGLIDANSCIVWESNVVAEPPPFDEGSDSNPNSDEADDGVAGFVSGWR